MGLTANQAKEVLIIIESYICFHTLKRTNR